MCGLNVIISTLSEVGYIPEDVFVHFTPMSSTEEFATTQMHVCRHQVIEHMENWGQASRTVAFVNHDVLRLDE